MWHWGRKVVLGLLGWWGCWLHTELQASETSDGLRGVRALPGTFPLGLNPLEPLFQGLDWKSKPRGGISQEWTLYYQGVRVENAYRVEALPSNSAQAFWLSWDIPLSIQQAAIVPLNGEWDEKRLVGVLPKHMHFNDWEMIYREKDGILQPFIRVRLNTSLASKGVFALIQGNTEETKFYVEEDLYAEKIKASAFVYAENKRTTLEITEEPLEGLISENFLWGQLFRVHNCQDQDVSYSQCAASFIGRQGLFEEDFDSPFYDEVLAYYAFQKAARFYQERMGSKREAFFYHFGLKTPLDIFVRSFFVLGTNSGFDAALYRKTGVSPLQSPVILVGSGYETIQSRAPGPFFLLGKDADVFWHEFGHHILTRSLNLPAAQMSLQSRALHEGTSDYFAYAISGNARLAESVEQSQGFLRTALNETTFGEVELSGGFYDWGEAWSGALWKLREQLGQDKFNHFLMDKIVFYAIDYLTANAGIYQMSCALLKATEELLREQGKTETDVENTKSQIISELLKRNVFSQPEIDESGFPPPGEPVLTTGLSEDGLTELAPTEVPKTEVLNSEALDGKVPAPPRRGSLYRPIQSGNWCGWVGNSQGKVISLWMLLPLLWTWKKRGKIDVKPFC